MSKLNAEELAKKLFVKNISPMTPLGETVFAEQRRAAAIAIREVAQPIADQRDELLEAAKRVLEIVDGLTRAEQNDLPSMNLNGLRDAITKATQP